MTVHKQKTTTAKKSTPMPGQNCFAMKKQNIGIPGCTNLTYPYNSTYLGKRYHREITRHKTPAIKTTAVATENSWEKIPPHFFAPADNTTTYQPCYTYNHNGIIVKQCPDEFYDNERDPLIAAPVEYSQESNRTEYYPNYDEDIKDPNKPENQQTNDPPLPDRQLCFRDCK